jgi:5-deoxy-5-amino-3-dehydroquinate synthase
VALLELMAHDKKAVTGTTFVLDSPDGVEVVTGVPDAEVLAALEATT